MTVAARVDSSQMAARTTSLAVVFVVEAQKEDEKVGIERKRVSKDAPKHGVDSARAAGRHHSKSRDGIDVSIGAEIMFEVLAGNEHFRFHCNTGENII